LGELKPERYAELEKLVIQCASTSELNEVAESYYKQVREELEAIKR